jgi:CheY-like chemotaxis protein
VVETLVLTPPLQDLVTRGATAQELHRAAVAAGMHTMLQAALDRVRAGETTLHEVERVLGEQVEHAAATSAGDPRVLVVEDDPVVRMVASRLLKDAGYEPVCVPDGEAALNELRERPDAAACVLDLGLPGINGHEVLRQIRSTPATAGMPVIVLTAASEVETEVRVLELGADDYIRKPLEPKRFAIRIKAALRRAAAA